MMNFNQIKLLILFFFSNSILIFISVILVLSMNFKIILEFELVKLSSKSLTLLLMIDIYSLIFMFVVNMISLSVYLFSKSYMSQDLSNTRFELVLLTFVLSMYLLILSPNLFSLLIGWDGLGISSYLLVIYYMNNKSYNSGMITALSNRVGDSLLIISVVLMFYLPSLSCYFLMFNKNYSMFWFILIAATTKSAQIPFSAWLPAAMAAPTPVSALVHSSTLVTAGVYLVFRFMKFSLLFPMNNYLMLIGAATMIMSSISAMIEMDLKKLIALSTLSQLGVMMLALGTKNFNLGMFHLFSHAFFKALMFIAGGHMIHMTNSYQDLRSMSNLMGQLPLTSSIFLLCNISLSGIPFFSSFYSKEIILESLIISNSNPMLYFLMITGVLFTLIYSFRMIYFSLIIKNMSPPLMNIYDKNFNINMSMMVLLVPALTGGKLLSYTLPEFNSFVITSLNMKIFLMSMMLMIILQFTLKNIFSIKITFKSWMIFNMWSLPIITYRLPMLMLKMKSEMFYMNSDFLYLYLMKINMIIAAYKYSVKTNFNFSSSNFSNIIVLSIMWTILTYIL